MNLKTIAEDSSISFYDHQERTITLDRPFLIAVFLEFHNESLNYLHFNELVLRAYKKLGWNIDEESSSDLENKELLAQAFDSLRRAGSIQVQLNKPCWVIEPGTYPVASPLVRVDAMNQDVTVSLHHKNIQLDDKKLCDLLVALDGTYNRDNLIEIFKGKLTVQELDELLFFAAENGMLMS